MDLNIVQKRKGMVTHSATSTKGNRKRKRVYVPRRTRKFQLRNSHPQDMHVAEILDYARSKRQEVTMIRNAVQLEYSLGQGDMSILLERFPWIVEALKVAAPPAPPDNTELLNEILRNQRLLLERGITDTRLPPSPIAAAPKPLATKAVVSAPTFDDDDDLPTVTVSKNKDTDLAANFLKSLSGLAH